MKSLKSFTICEMFPADHLKAEKNRSFQGCFPAICNIVFSSSIKFGLMIFFNQQALGREQIYLTVQQILGNSIEGNAINIIRGIPIFFVAKNYVMEYNFAKIYICACLKLESIVFWQSFPPCFLFGLLLFLP